VCRPATVRPPATTAAMSSDARRRHGVRISIAPRPWRDPFGRAIARINGAASVMGAAGHSPRWRFHRMRSTEKAAARKDFGHAEGKVNWPTSTENTS
jgi:hypothetical protein